MSEGYPLLVSTCLLTWYVEHNKSYKAREQKEIPSWLGTPCLTWPSKA